MHQAVLSVSQLSVLQFPKSYYRCRTEYEQRDKAVREDTETQKRFHSYVLFLGELYLHLEVSKDFTLKKQSSTLHYPHLLVER